MKKISILFGLFLLVGLVASAQYRRMFYKNVTVENDFIRITVDDAIATEKVCKFKCRMYNKTSQYLLVKPDEFTFKFKTKDAKPPKERWLVLRPNDESSRVIDIPGDYRDKDGYTVVADGIFLIDPNKDGLKAPDFKLPPSQNDFTAGGFRVTKIAMKKETDRTDVKFECFYSGTKVGMFEPNKVGMKMPDGTEHANYHSDRKVLIFGQGDRDKFTVTFKDVPIKSGDMQFVEMLILWRDAFREADPVKQKPTEIKVEFDEALTAGKN